MATCVRVREVASNLVEAGTPLGPAGLQAAYGDTEG